MIVSKPTNKAPELNQRKPMQPRVEKSRHRPSLSEPMTEKRVAAEEAGWQLDAWIAEHVMCWPKAPWGTHFGKRPYFAVVPIMGPESARVMVYDAKFPAGRKWRPSRDIEAARELPGWNDKEAPIVGSRRILIATIK